MGLIDWLMVDMGIEIVVRVFGCVKWLMYIDFEIVIRSWLFCYVVYFFK